MRAGAALVCLTALALGCASEPWRCERVGITLDELLTGAPLRELEAGAPLRNPEAGAPLREAEAGAPLGLTPGAAPLVQAEDVLAVSAEMRAFLDAHVTGATGRVLRLRQLAASIVSSDSFGLEYDETTRTAAETFRTRRGNCLSFSNMFVAMAREVGLTVHYQEVETPPDWSFRDEAFVLNRHVNVLVDLGREGEHVVDFNMDDFRSSYDRHTISDDRALAHHFNNLAVERMQAGDDASALRYFRRAAEHDPLFSPAWTNLGILYLRHGHPEHAEAAYLQALRVDKWDLTAMSNLASLYERQGDHARAAECKERVIDHRRRNPYYRLQLAREAFLAEDYDAAIDHLEYAIRTKKNEDQLYYLLGLSYTKKGDERTARRWLSRAEEVAATDALKRRYASKIEILLSASPDRAAPE
jgi:Flp pilus assembly protein TadD